MTTTNPTSVVVSAEIDIHQAIKAVREFAKKYPVDRLSTTQANEIINAGECILQRLKRTEAQWTPQQSSVTP